MKKIISIFFVCVVYISHGQSLHPVKWKFIVEEKKDGEAELIFQVKIEKEWHIYSQFTSDGGPLPMLFTFETSGCYSLVGNVVEPKPIEEFDSLFGVKVLYLVKDVTLKQKIKYTETSCKVKGSVSYQACKDACIALDTTFTFDIGKGKKDKSEAPSENPVHGSIPGGKSVIKSKELAEITPVDFFINSSR